jgi:deazaflavin-dependent oxidoreductase (nitroreductase family)
MERTTCCVIGGGPAGLMLGLILARRGVEVTVLEKHGDFLRDFRGDTVHPSTLQLLDELGLGERFAKLDQSKVEQVAFPVDEQQRMLVVGDFTRLRVRHPYIALLPQWDFLNLLAEAAAEEPTFTLRMSTEATDLTFDGDRVTGVRYRTRSGETGELAATLTVACDGRTSMARRQAELPVAEFPVGIDAWWFRLPRLDGDRFAALSPRMGVGRFGIVIPREGFLQIAYLGHKGIDAELRERGVEAFRRDVAALIPSVGDRVDMVASMDDVKHLDIRLNRLNHWHRDGLLCIGDAAHAMSPLGGVGINLAIQDAVAAARLLAEPLTRGTLTSADLAAVRRRRLLPTILVQGMQRFMQRAIVDPVLDGQRPRPPRAITALMRWFPQASFIPAYLIGVGVRPEHAPDYARRPMPARPAGFARRLAQVNKKGLNRLTRRLFRNLPGFGVVLHRGRRSGRTYEAPVNVFPTENGFVFALTYGSDTDWVRNVLAAGRAELRTHGRTVALTDPEVYRDPTRQRIRPVERWVLGLLGIDEFLRMERA